MPSRTDLAALHATYTEACNYNSSVVDEGAVETALRAYLGALGATRAVTRLRSGWTLDGHPSLSRSVQAIVRAARATGAAQDAQDAQDALAARDARVAWDARDARAAQDAQDAQDALDARAAQAARDARVALDAGVAHDALDALDARVAWDAQAARAARDAQDAQDARLALDARAASAALDDRAALETRNAQAMQRFAAWCVYRGWWWTWDLSWLATTYLGAVERGDVSVQQWARPVFEAFVAGAWLLYWTDDTLYWAARPRVHAEQRPRRLHRADGPALDSDLDSLYFWHGVLVPPHAIMAPETITLAEVQAEPNAEVRRALIERMGWDRYLIESRAHLTHADRFGDLYEIEMDGARLGIVLVANSTPEPDGTRKRYALRVPAGYPSAHAAVAATFGRTPETYDPAVET